MLSARKRWTTQRNLMLLGLFLATYQLAVYRPLCRYVDDQDAPLVGVWKQLLELSPYAKGLDAGYLQRIRSGYEQALDSTRALGEVQRLALARIDPDPALKARMNLPFQLIEFQNERQVRLEELSRLASQTKTGLGPGVAEGFPEYTAGRRDPALLWPQLAAVHHAVAGAIQAQVSTVSVVRLPPMVLHPAPTNATETLVEIPLKLELAGNAEAVSRFLESLPLLPEELKARGLPEALPGKPALFVGGLLLRKVDRTQPNQVRLEVGLSRFVMSTRSGPEP